jgi:hypothetical protein
MGLIVKTETWTLRIVSLLPTGTMGISLKRRISGLAGAGALAKRW